MVIVVIFVASILIISATYQYVIFPSELRSHENQQYEYLYDCGGASYFQSQTTFLSPSIAVNDSLFGPGFFSLQLNVQTDGGTSIQAVALIRAIDGTLYTQFAVEGWQNGGTHLVLNVRGPVSRPVAISKGDSFGLEIIENTTQQYTALLKVVGTDSSSPLLYTSLRFQLASGLKMVEAQAGVYGFGNSSKATFSGTAAPLFTVSLSTNSSARSSSVGGNCGEGEWTTLETSNLGSYDVTASAHTVTYSLKVANTQQTK